MTLARLLIPLESMYGDIHEEQMADKNIKAIHQFLMNHHFESTAESLIKEASKMGFQNLKLGTFADLYIQLMSCYNTGDYLTFFQLWDVLFPKSIKQCKEYKKLTFYIHVHFAVLPKRKLYAQNTGYEPTSRIGALNSFSIEDPISQKYKENNANEIEKRINNSMKQLQDYLNEDGKELEHDTELQPFYALPFIEDFYADTFLANILEQSWLDKLTDKINSFIRNHRQELIDTISNKDVSKMQNTEEICKTASAMKTTAVESVIVPNKTIKNNIPIIPNDRDIPIFLEEHNDEEQYEFSHETNRSLKSKSTQTHIIGDQTRVSNSRTGVLNMGESNNSLLKMQKADKRLMQCNQKLALTKTHLCSVHTNYEKLKVRFHKLHTDYHKLIDVAGELTVALENSVKGQAVDIQRTLEICMKIFPDLFNQNIRDASYPSLLQLAHTDVKTITLPKLDITALPISPNLLDYKKIKLHLLNGDVKTKLLLLQALRWKITQSTEQDEVLHEYINRDLLGLHGQIASDSGKLVLPSLLIAGEVYARHLLQQFTARLLNALASFRCGRDYLSVGSIIVNVTFACLNNNYIDDVDSFGCDMMVAMLQKLSLRSQQRIYMIESGLLEWLINHLHDKCRIINLYQLEYATALLMNLSLHRLAQARASKVASLLVSTLLILFSLDHASSLPYINGALNNFLNHPTINEEAKKMRHLNTLDFESNQKTAEIRKHLDHVLKTQKREILNTSQDAETGDDDNEELDILENEIDENDPLQNYVGELNGETLLAMCYSLPSKIPQDTLNTNTILQKISSTNPHDFYDIRQKNHIHSKRSYSTLRYVKMKSKMLPKKSCTKQAAFAKQILNLSNSSLKEQQIARNSTNKKFSVDETQNIAKQSIDTESSFIMKYNESGTYESQNNFTLDDLFWTSNAVLNQNQHKFDHHNHVKTTMNPRPMIDNNVRNDRLKLHASKNRVRTSSIHDESFGRTKLGKFPSKNIKSFKQNLSEISNDTIYLYENQTSIDSSETVAASSMTLASVHESDQTETEKFSSIASLNINTYDSNVVNDATWKNDSELAKEAEAFLAKPKLSRTPP